MTTTPSVGGQGHRPALQQRPGLLVSVGEQARYKIRIPPSCLYGFRGLPVVGALVWRLVSSVG
jgi:hypothetical protein